MEIEPSLPLLPEKFQSLLFVEYYSLEKTNPTLAKSLLSLFFENWQDFESSIKFLKEKYRKEMCSAAIDQGELSFKCYDCGRENEFHIYCENCFINGEHKGHRMMYSCERGGCCDCGDLAAIDEIGFCKLHKGLAGIDKDILTKVPLNIGVGLEKYFFWGFEFIIREFEKIMRMEAEFEKGDYSLNLMKIDQKFKNEFSSDLTNNTNQKKNENMNENKNEPNKNNNNEENNKNNNDDDDFLSVDSEENVPENDNHAVPVGLDKEIKEKTIKNEKEKLREFYKDFFGGFTDLCTDNLCLSFLISHFLMKKGISEQFYHQCDDLEKVSLCDGKKNCSCSSLELIFRFNSMLEDSIQDSLEKFFFNLFVNLEFKKQLVVVYSRMINFIINYERLPNGKIRSFTSKIRPIYTQFFSEELMDLFLGNNILENSLTKIHYLLSLLNEDSYETLYEKFLEFYNLFYYVNERKNSMKNRLLNTDFIDKFVWALFGKRQEKFLSLEQQKILLHIGKLALLLFEEYIIHFHANLSLDDFNCKMLKLLDLFVKNRDHFFSSREEFLLRYTQNNLLFSHENSSRAISIILGYMLSANTSLQSVLSRISGSFDKDLILFLMERNMQVLLFFQEVFNKKQSQYSNLGEFQTTKFLLQVYFGGQITNFLDYHIFFLQIMSGTLSNPEEISSIFSPISKNNRVFIDNSNLEKASEIRYFMENMAILMTNETAYLNSSSMMKINRNSSFDYRNQIMNSLLANFFIAKPKFTFKDLKGKIQKCLLNKNIEFKDHLLEIAQLDSETKEFRLKLAYHEIYEPFFWGSVFELGSKYFENLRDLSKKNKKIDFLLGAQGKYEKNPLILNLIDTVNHPDILEFLYEVFDKCSKMTEFVRISLKILYLLMEYQGDSVVMMDFLERNRKGLLGKLEELRETKEFEEIHLSLEIVIKLIQKITQNIGSSTQIPLFHNLSEKKSKNEARKNSILAQFQQKQLNFAEKNQEFLDDEDLNAPSQTAKYVCNICHEKEEISTEIFEISAYLAFDNLHNYYYLEREKSPYIISNNILNPERFLLIACNHPVHKSCLQSFLHKQMNHNVNELSFKCFCCKFSCNISIPLISSFAPQSIKKSLGKVNSETLSSACHTIIHEFQKVLYEDISDVTTPLLTHPVGTQAIDQFINKVIMIVLQQKNDGCHEYFIIDVLLDSLMFFAEEAFSEGVKYFIKKRFLINRNIFLIAKQVFWNFRTSQTFNDYVKNFKIGLMKDIEKLMSLDENPIYFLRNIDLFFSKIIWKMGILMDFEKNEHFFVYFAKILINKLILVFSYFFLLEASQKPILGDIFKAFENFDFRMKVLSFLTPYYHLISSLFFVIFNFDERLLAEKLGKDLEINEEILEFSSFFGNLFSISEEIQTTLGLSWINRLDSLNQIQIKVLNSEILKNPGLKFTFTPNSQEFQKFYSKFIAKKCENCHDYPRMMKADLFICIICETVLCNSTCKNHPKSIGNLTKHLVDRHCGKGFFINVMDTRVLWIDIPTVIPEDFLFSDSLGQCMTKKSMNWGDFNLNSGKMERLRRILVKRELTQEIYYHVLKNPKDVFFTEEI